MRSRFGSELGSALKGVAALLMALVAVAGLYYGMRTGASQETKEVVMAPRQNLGEDDGVTSNLGNLSMGASQLDLEASEASMKIARKAARARQCENVQPDTWNRGEIMYGKAQDSQAAGRLGEAIMRFRESAVYYKQCDQG